MRRVLTILTAIALLVVSFGIGALTADLPFWRRALQLPLAPDATYLPVAHLGVHDGPDVPAPGPASPPIIVAAPAFDAQVIETAAEHARGTGSRALLVAHRGHLAIERYFAADDADTLLPASVIARPIAAMAVGLALGEKRLPRLDSPVSALLTEWDGQPRGRITLRQLLEDTSGLETGGPDAAMTLTRSPWSDLPALPRFATSRAVRMLLGNDYESTALHFQLEHEPGGFHNLSPANTQLVAVLIERATGQPYERFVDEHIWSAIDGGRADLQMDRRSGMPAAHCCWLASARAMLRVAALLTHDGVAQGRQVLPAGWVAEMTRASRVSAGTGMQLERIQVEGVEAFEARGAEGSAFWVIPSRGLTILDVGTNPDAPLRELPALLLRGLAAP